MNRIFSISLIGLLTCFLSLNLVAQNGWKDIENNDFIAAKKAFEKTLETDENNKDALYGLIFLSEIMEDDDKYEKHVTQLVKSRWDEQEFLLFGHVIDAEAPEILKQKLSNRAKAGAYFSLADSLFYHRRKKDAFKVLNDFVGDLLEINKFLI